MQEIWKDILGYEGLYQISNYGNVRSLHWNHSNQIRLLTPFDNDGYLRIGFRQQGKLKNHLIHVLVAKAFIPNPNNLPQVNHKDGNKHNNLVSNLEWISNSDNVKHAIRNHLRNSHASKSNPSKVYQYSLDGKLLAIFPSQHDAANKLHLAQANISKAIRRNKQYANYYWKTD
jgi:hypothetical protein